MNALGYPYQYRVEIVFNDLDAMGHVNNVRYFVFMETARIKLLNAIFQETQQALALPIILADAQCSYKSPALFGEELIIGIGISRIGTKSFTAVYRIDTTNGRFVAEAQSVQVMYDYTSGQTIPIPDDIKSRILTFQDGWQPVQTE